VEQEELARVAAVRLRVLLLPEGGAMAMREIRIVPKPPEAGRGGPARSSATPR
jgi:hypothetical protein